VLANLLKEQHAQLQQFIISQHEKMKESLREELKTELSKEIQLQTESLVDQVIYSFLVS
jgi:hypothetical protein